MDSIVKRGDRRKARMNEYEERVYGRKLQDQVAEAKGTRRLVVVEVGSGRIE